MTSHPPDPILRQQQQYYSARAAEYDQWWLRQGRYDRGPENNARWFAEAKAVQSALARFRPSGNILELACGTGIWTQHLLPFAGRFTALDGSSEMLALNAARIGSASIRYLQADIFQWQPDQAFDTVFFGFWLSHVPPDRFHGFWSLIRACLARGGRVFMVDSLCEASSAALDHQPPNPESNVQRRRLNNGREFDVIKVFYHPEALAGRLRDMGWSFNIQRTDRYFLYGGSRSV